MPKFKCVLVKPDTFDEKGTRHNGISAAIPLDDAAKMDGITDLAVDLKKYVPSSPNEKKDMGKKLLEKAYKAQFKEGRIDETQLSTAMQHVKNM